uniref:AIPR family protein n=1 Tax=Trichocoleus desertorum TaxID=1481672 RepID=UPI0025B4BB14|nr:AIPR family protein [Trichocoleus desertorum]
MANKLPLPSYLETFDLLQQHIRGQLEGLSTTEKGKRFARFVQRLIPQADAGAGFEMPELNSKLSNDGGVDLIGKDRKTDRTLYIQSKLYVDRADSIDSVISKFQAFKASDKSQLSLFDTDDTSTHFLLATLSPLTGILDKYKKQQYASKNFYERCVNENRIHFIDGYEILNLLKNAHGKLSQVPTNLTINFETPYIHKDDVYIGVISSFELKELHRKFGDALFFENVRDFLGVQTGVEKMGRTTPNLEIIKTIKNEPEKMLSRNNGLVLGAEKVEQGLEENQLILKNGSVVNGCQTTMCLVEYSEKSSFVLVKIVQTPDAWDITKSANYQTAVPDIDLELARYLRPQLVKRAAENFGVQLKDIERSAFQLIDEIYDRKVAYSETRLLYIGLLSRTPNNVFASNYTELFQDLIIGLYKNGVQEEEIFELLFLLQGISQESLNESKAIFSNPSYSNFFERLYKEDSLSYRSFLSILALCGTTNTNIVERETDIAKEIARVKGFIERAGTTLKNDKDRFKQFHKLSIKLWMQDLLDDEDEAKVRRDMYLSSKKMNFNNMFRKLCIEADLGQSLQSST